MKISAGKESLIISSIESHGSAVLADFNRQLLICA